MTYKLNPILDKILSPVVLILPEGKRVEFINGKEASEHIFNEKYKIVSIRAIKETVEIELKLFLPFDGNESFF